MILAHSLDECLSYSEVKHNTEHKGRNNPHLQRNTAIRSSLSRSTASLEVKKSLEATTQQLKELSAGPWQNENTTFVKITQTTEKGQRRRYLHKSRSGQELALLFPFLVVKRESFLLLLPLYVNRLTCIYRENLFPSIYVGINFSSSLSARSLEN